MASLNESPILERYLNGCHAIFTIIDGKKAKAPRRGIRAKVCQTVTVFAYKEGNLQFAKGTCIRIENKYHRVVVRMSRMRISVRRVRDERTEKAM